jgi:hypothetical protein
MKERTKEYEIASSKLYMCDKDSLSFQVNKLNVI